MLTKWNMTFFLFFGVLSAGILLGNALRSLLNERHGKPSYGVLVATVSAVAAMVVLLLTIASPAKLLNILGHPSAGLSSAIIADTLLIAVSAIFYFKTKNGGNRPFESVSILVSIACIYCFSRIYMIVTRPALDTALVFLMLLMINTYVAVFFFGYEKLKSAYLKMYLVVVLIFGAVFAVFIFRMNALPTPDRVLQLPKLISGSLMPLFWVTVVVTFIVPLAVALYSNFSKTAYRRLFLSIGVIGLFCLCVLINQMPVVSRGVDGRFFY